MPRRTLAFELPSAKLGATADPGRKIHKFEICVLALVRDANGEVVDKYSLDKPYYIADANLAAVRADQLTYTHVLDLPPGRYTVDAAVVDHEGAQATARNRKFRNPRAAQRARDQQPGNGGTPRPGGRRSRTPPIRSPSRASTSSLW